MARSQCWIAIALAGTLTGCSNGSGMLGGNGAPAVGDKSEPTKDTPGGKATGGASAGSKGGSTFSEVPPVSGVAAAALKRVGTCDELLASIHEDVAAKIEMQAELMREEPEQGYYPVGRGGPVFAAGGAAAEAPQQDFAAPRPAPPPVAMNPAAMGMASSPGGTGNVDSKSSGPSDFSKTNVQVKGVDEADIVKTDGEHIYLLHGNQFFVLDSWPADMTAVSSKADVEGNVLEMFVHHGIAVVFSSVYDQGDLIDPKASADADADAADAVLRPGPYPYYSRTFTKITVIDANAKTPEVQRELFVEGDYVSARRIANTVRTVIRDASRFPAFYGGYIEYRDQWGRPYPQDDIDAQVDNWRDRTIRAAEDTELADWLPVERELKDGKLTAPKPRCGDFYVPSAGLANGGVTDILSFDLSDPESALGGAVVLGMADEVYANDAALVLAYRDWRWDQQLIERERTVLHRFELGEKDTVYTASGTVTGHIVDQFSIDEREGVIRVATTARFWPDFIPRIPAIAEAAAMDDPPDQADPKTRRQTDNRVITLQAKDNELVRLDMTEPLGKDGETIQSTRFVEDRGYVVTFERIDPLIVLDLAKPDSILVLGQANIPGFSEYMHPLDADHLLTIGQDADQNGFVTGLMLSIFDVSDPTKPTRSHSFRFGPNGYSEAGQNHKAFTFHRPENAQGFDGLLAFPYVNYNTNFQSSLQVFEVSADQGFKQLGAVDHTQLLRDVCRPFDPQGVDSPSFYPCIQPDVRRGLFIFGDEGDFVYSIGNGGVLVHTLTDLVQAVATVPLPFPDYNDHRVWRGDGPSPFAGGGSSPGVGVGVATPATPAPPPRPQP